MDNNELGTNLAEVGTDCISRQAAIDALDQIFDRCEEIEAHLPEGDPDRTGYKMYPDYMTVWKYLHQLPTAQPEIIRCAECKWFQCNMRQDGYLPKGVDEFECRHWHGSCDPTDFCSQGTRREVTT